MKRIGRVGAILAGLVVFTAAPARAQFGTDEPPAVQIAGFAGYQFGGSIFSETFDRKFSFKSGLNYGGTLDFRIGETWRFEIYYSRQDTELEGALAVESPFELKIERLMVGLQEEKGEGSVKWFGTILVGATRYTPVDSAFTDDTRFSAGLGLGVKSFFSKNVGLRLEGHAFYTLVESGGGAFCTPGFCAFSYSGRGIWQGDFEGGLIIAF
jgi:hypothetical protein